MISWSRFVWGQSGSSVGSWSGPFRFRSSSGRFQSGPVWSRFWGRCGGHLVQGRSTQHSKAVCVDHTYLLSGSANLSHNSKDHCYEFGIGTNLPAVLEEYEDFFNINWDRGVSYELADAEHAVRNRQERVAAKKSGSSTGVASHRGQGS